jgi:hypothetical protein
MCSNAFTINGVGYRVTKNYRIHKRFTSCNIINFVGIESELFTSIWLNLQDFCFQVYSNSAIIDIIALNFVKNTSHLCISKAKPISMVWKLQMVIS